MKNPLQKLLDSKGVSKVDASRKWRINPRTLRMWCSDKAPRNVLLLVKMILDLTKLEDEENGNENVHK